MIAVIIRRFRGTTRGKQQGENSLKAPRNGIRGAIACLVVFMAVSSPFARAGWAQTGGKPAGFQVIRGAEFSESVVPYEIDMDLRDLPRPPVWKLGDAIKEVPRRRTSPATPVAPPKPRVDPLLAIQQEAAPKTRSRSFSTTLINMDGLGFNGANPPDTVGDVGIDYYIQSTNGMAGTYYTIHDKSDGGVAAGPLMMSDLGGSDGAGDPIVLYDSLASRWLISEFASFGNTLIVYISRTSDPITGGWHVYEFTTPNFPDYPKYAVWPDAYYVTSNEDSPAAYALPREKMLAGDPASFQRFTVAPLGGFGFNVITPCDLDGAEAPPGGSPNYIMRHRDDEAHGGSDPSQDFLEIYEFSVDWDNPGNSTLSGPVTISVTDFDSNLNGLIDFKAIDQPGTPTRLDPLREPIMFRLVYRNFGSHETLVGSFVTDVDGTDHAGVRWFELRKSGGSSWSLHQEGTYAPDEHSRWMSAIAMDGSGGIAMGYNISSTSVYPGIRYVGRLVSDPPGTMPRGEYTLVNGSASNASNRYGDYSAMSVDPVNDCTFWFTGQYNTSGSWSTRIGSFVFEECGCTPPAPPDAFIIADTSGIAPGGLKGGPFLPSSKTYTIRNTSTCTIDWTASKTASWLTLSPVGGTLQPLGVVALEVYINSTAESLNAGQYNDTLTIENDTSANGPITRPVLLTVYDERFVDSDPLGDCAGFTPCHHSPQGAVDDAGDATMIKLMGGVYNESIVTNGNDVILDGGWNASFSGQSSSSPTILSGPTSPTLVIEQKITVKNLVLE